MPTLGAVFPRNMRAERVRRELNQAELGEIIGWTQSKVGDIESGRTALRADHLAPICKALGLPLSVLAQGADPADVEALGL